MQRDTQMLKFLHSYKNENERFLNLLQQCETHAKPA